MNMENGRAGIPIIRRGQGGVKLPSRLASHVDGFFVFHAEENPHRILIIHEAHRREGDAVSQEPLCLRWQSLCFFGWDHKVLILCRSVIWLAEEYSNRLSGLISVRKSEFPMQCFNGLTITSGGLLCDVPTAGMVQIPDKYQGIAWFQFSWNSFFVVGATIGSPDVRSGNADCGPILLGGLGYGCHTSQHHRHIDVAGMIVAGVTMSLNVVCIGRGGLLPVVTMQHLLSTSRIHSECHGPLVVSVKYMGDWRHQEYHAGEQEEYSRGYNRLRRYSLLRLTGPKCVRRGQHLVGDVDVCLVHG